MTDERPDPLYVSGYVQEAQARAAALPVAIAHSIVREKNTLRRAMLGRLYGRLDAAAQQRCRAEMFEACQ